MRDRAAYLHKFHRMESGTLLRLLEPSARAFVSEIACDHRFTQQELRMVVDAARDLEMWRQRTLEEWWREAASGLEVTGRERKKALLRRLGGHLEELAASETEYPSPPLSGPPPGRKHHVETATPRTVLGPCPAYSERTVCCGLQTIDAVIGCPSSCSYCTIQTFQGGAVEFRQDLAARLEQVEIEPDRFYHIGSGQSSDSLGWGNRGGVLQDLLDFAARHPNVLLELKTKSDQVRHLLEHRVSENVLCSWSLNPQRVIANEEHGTASFEERLRAARAVADRGLRVGFHFHPMIRYRGWKDDYGEVARRILALFSPLEVAFVSMGSPTFIRPVLREIRRRGGETRILQMPMTADPHGKLTYPDEVKLELYSSLYRALHPWHERVFFYLCMETPPMWKAVLGRTFADNGAFEDGFARRVGGCPSVSLLSG